MGFDPMGMFKSGQEIGKGNKTPFAYGANNVMDEFKTNRQLQAQAGVQGALEDYKQQLTTKYEPERKKQELQTEYGLQGDMFNKVIKGLSGGGDQSTSNDASKPAQQGSMDSKKTNTPMWKSVKLGPIEIGNPNYDAAQKQAEMGPQVEGGQLKQSSSDANDAALMMQKLDEIRGLHDKAMQGVQRANSATKSPFGIATRMGQGMQAGQLAMQGPDNPDWQNYEKSKKNFSYAADRGLFGEKGKLIAQQLNAGTMMFPNATGTKEGDQGLWKTLYSLPQKTIGYHNGLVDQYQADPSLKVQNNSQYAKADSLRDEAVDAIKRGANGKQVAQKFKNMTGMDL